MESTFFPLLAVIDTADTTRGEPGSVLTLLVIVPSRRAIVKPNKEGTAKSKGRKVLGFPALVWNYSGTVQAPLAEGSLEQLLFCGKAENRGTSPKCNKHSSPHPQYLRSEQGQISVILAAEKSLCQL